MSGGKRDQDLNETAAATAAREVEEETHWCLTAEEVLPLLQPQHSCWWVLRYCTLSLYWFDRLRDRADTMSSHFCFLAFIPGLMSVCMFSTWCTFPTSSTCHSA